MIYANIGSNFWIKNKGLIPILGNSQNNNKATINKIRKKDDFGKVIFLFKSFLSEKNKEDINHKKNKITIIKINNLSI